MLLLELKRSGYFRCSWLCFRKITGRSRLHLLPSLAPDSNTLVPELHTSTLTVVLSLHRVSWMLSCSFPWVRRLHYTTVYWPQHHDLVICRLRVLQQSPRQPFGSDLAFKKHQGAWNAQSCQVPAASSIRMLAGILYRPHVSDGTAGLSNCHLNSHLSGRLGDLKGAL